MTSHTLVVSPALEESVTRLVAVINRTDVKGAVMIGTHVLHYSFTAEEYAWLAARIEDARPRYGVVYSPRLDCFMIGDVSHAQHVSSGWTFRSHHESNGRTM